MKHHTSAAMSMRIEAGRRSGIKATPKTRVRYRGASGPELATPGRDFFAPDHPIVLANRDAFELVVDPLSPRGELERLVAQDAGHATSASHTASIRTSCASARASARR
jgi:hypothetical protein